MKSKISMIAFTALVTLSVLTSSAQKTIETSFEVSGVCAMCEERIEGALDTKGVIRADYNLDTHTLKVAYKPKKITIDTIHQKLNAVGHDTEKSKATNEQYDRVHHCCKYREHKHNH